MVGELHVTHRRGPQVADQNGSILAARREDRSVQVVPRERADSCQVAVESAHLLLLVDVPYLHLARFGSHAQMASFVRPAQGSDLVVVAEVAELRNGERRGIPYVDG